MTDALICFCTCPPERAQALAQALVQERLVACVNVVPAITSIYRWREEIQQDAESLLIIKTTQARYPELEAALRAQHSYELPELIAVPVVEGIPAYLSWLTASVQ
jgi:periplasmic divalent cation tolerance protein